MGRAGALLRSCHPQPTAAVTAIALAYAGVAGAGRRTPVVGAAVLAQQLSIGWSNVALDVARDRIAGRTDKPVADGQLSQRSVIAAATVALVLSVPLSLFAGGRYGLGNLACAVSGWTYNLGVKGTVGSPLPYVVGFGGLATFLDGAATPGIGVRPAVAAAGALLGGGAHFANVLPDLAADLGAGLRGVPHRLGERRSRAVCAALLGAAGVAVAALPGPGRALTAMATGGLGAVAARAGSTAGSRRAFQLTMAVAGLDVGALLLRGARAARVAPAAGRRR